MKNKIIKIATGILTLSIVLTSCGGKKPENAIAKVGDKYITAEEINTNFESTRAQQKMYTGADPFDESTDEGRELANQQRAQILDSLVYNETALSLADKEGIKADEKEIEKAIEAEIKNFGGEDALKGLLKAQGMTREDFDKDMKEYYETQMIFTKLTEKFQEDFKPSDEDVTKKIEKDKDQYLPAFNADHILYSIKDETNNSITDEEKINQIKAEAEETLKQISEGTLEFQAKFDEINNKNKEATSKGEGGEIAKTSGDTLLMAENLGNFTNSPDANGNQMVKEFLTAVNDMEADTVSEKIVETEFGYHIIKLNSKSTEIKDLDENYLKDLKEQVSATIITEKISKALEEQEKSLKIVYYDKDGKEVEDGLTAIKSFDFKKITEEQAKKAKETKATDGSDEKKSNDSTEAKEEKTTEESSKSTGATEAK